MKSKFILFLLACLTVGFVIGCFTGCVAQGVRLADGTTVVNHAALSHKSDAESATSDVTLPGGTHIVQQWNATKPDGTEWTKYFTAYKLPLGVAKISGHSTDVKEQQTTAREANARPPVTTSSTTTDATGATSSTTTVVPPATASIPSIK